MKLQIVLNFVKKIASDTISKYNQLKLEIDNNKLNQNNTNIYLDDMFTAGPKEFREVNKKTNAVGEALIKNTKIIVQYMIAMLLESKLVDDKKQAKLEMHYDFNNEDIMKEIESYFIYLRLYLYL